MADASQTDDVWRKLFRSFPDRPLRAVLGTEDEPAASTPAPSWAGVRAKAAHLLSGPGDDALSPPLVALLRSWTPELAAEVASAPGRKTLIEVFGRCWDWLRSLAADPVGAHSALDTIERELRDAFIGCGDRAAEVVLFAGARTNAGRPAERSHSPEERKQALLFFLGLVSDQIPDENG
jgi:hypothetical protein